jgi:hypothetical protein
MANYIGRRTAIGFGKESARGTTVAATAWDKQVDLSIDDKIESVAVGAAFGQIEDSEDSLIVKKWSEGSITANAKNESAGLLLLSLMGTDTPATASGEAIVYDHVFTVSNSNSHPTLTIATDDPTQDYRFANCLVDTFELNGEVGKFCQYKATWQGQKGATATNTPAYNADDRLFLPQHATLKQASAIAGLTGATAIKIKKFSVKFEQNIIADDVLGSTSPNDFLNRHFAVSGEIELYFNNESDWKAYQLADTQRAMRIDLINTDVTLGIATNPQLRIDLAKVKFTDLGRDIKNDDIVSQKVSFKATYSVTDTSMATVTLTNKTASY